MAQNIYDDPEFFAGYCGLPRSVKGLHGAAEWESLQALLPPLGGASVVDLGCGFGWFCRWAAAAGADSVLGIDLSANMLARAEAATSSPRIGYLQHDLDTLELSAGAFQLAYSSLTLHYLADIERLFRTVHGALTSGGHFVFSVEHPIFTAPSAPRFVPDALGHSRWPVDGYLAEGPRTTDWLAPGVVKQHRTIGAYVNTLVAAGFRVTALVEWGPSPEQVRDVPEWAVETERPPFLLVAADRT